MKYQPLILLFASGAFNMMSNAKAVVKEHELKDNNLFSPSIITLVKKYQRTINANYRKELLVAISWKALANLTFVLAFVLLFK